MDSDDNLRREKKIKSIKKYLPGLLEKNLFFFLFLLLACAKNKKAISNISRRNNIII